MSGLAQFVAARGLATLQEWCEVGYKEVCKVDDELSGEINVGEHCRFPKKHRDANFAYSSIPKQSFGSCLARGPHPPSFVGSHQQQTPIGQRSRSGKEIKYVPG